VGDADLNPMRLIGGLLGGVWPAHLAADPGNGRFEGASLVQNFVAPRPEGVWKSTTRCSRNPSASASSSSSAGGAASTSCSCDEILTIVRDL
jgi:hypothetical protein